MTTINSFISKEKVQVKSATSGTSLFSRYLDFAARQEKERMLWYLKAIMVLSCAVGA